MTTLVTTVFAVLADDGLKDEDITAGWTAFAIFILLGLAVAFLGWSLTRQLRKAQRAKDTGVYGDEPVEPTDPAEQAPPGPTVSTEK
ncbi:hypothetical protein [Nocardioides sp.]|uniref:hypothetical protein n=1 Tax=Nocardioides sp. TaxID=35761 RepID=UPI003D14130B